MQTDKEIKIAIIVGAIMITACIVAYIFYKSETNVNEIDLKVYKVNEKEKVYEECHITTDTQIQLNSEFKRATKLNESSRVIGKSITGTYKIVSNDNYIAFDNKENEYYIYRGDTKYLYEFNSTIYDLVETTCQ